MLKRIVFYGTSRTVTQGLLALRGLALAAILGPQLFGVWALFRIVMRYAAVSGLGVLGGLEAKVAQRSGSTRREEDAAREWARSALGYNLVVSGVIAAAAGGAAAFVPDRSFALALGGATVGILADRLWRYGMIYLRATGSLQRYATYELLDAILQLLVTVLLALAWGLPGAFVGFAIAKLAGFAPLLRHVPWRPTVSMSRIRPLLRIGFPTGVAGLLGTGMITMDRLVVGAVLGASALGHYAFAMAIAGLGGSLAGVIRTVVVRDLYGRARTEGARAANASHLSTAIVPFARLFPPLLGLCALFLGPAVVLLLPQYGEAVPIARIVIFLGIADGLASLGTLGVVASGRQRLLPFLAAAMLLLNLGLSLLALALDAGLEGVAVAALVSRIAHGTGIVLIVAKSAAARPNPLLPAGLLLPTLWCAAAVNVIGLALPDDGLNALAAALGLYAVALLPLGLAALAAWRHSRRPSSGSGIG